MADKRMFTKKIINNDNFITLSSSCQALYFHLNMSADDDGFSDEVSISMFRAHASVADLETLIDKKYVHRFENGVVVIKHWNMHNTIPKDRYKPTAYIDEKRELTIKENKAYTIDNSNSDTECIQNVYNLDTECIQDVNEMETQVRLGKGSLDKGRLGECSETHTPISYDELIKKYGKDFVDERIERAKEYYKSNFTIDKVKQWCEEDFISKKKKNKSKIAFNNFPQREYDMEELERQLLSRN